MARQGRFGRSETGATNLSSFIRSLVEQSSALNERALLNAFQDQTTYQGGVPDSGDIEAYVGRMTEGLDPNSPQYAYYMNMLENAKRLERQREVRSVTQSYEVSGGDDYESFYSEISDMLNNPDLSAEEIQDLESLLTEKTQQFVNIVAAEYTAGITSLEELMSRTDVAIGRLEGQNQENALLSRAGSIVSRETQSLENGTIDVATFRQISEIAMRGVEAGTPAAEDIGLGIQAAIWNKEKGKFDVALARSNNKGYSAKINANQNYIDWARGQLEELKAKGLGDSDMAKNIRLDIASKRTDLNSAKVAAYNAGYNSRKDEVLGVEQKINNLMKNIPLYVGGEKVVFDIDTVFGTSINNAIGAGVEVLRYLDFDPAARERFDALMEEYRGATADLYQYASANGAAGEAAAYRNRMKQVRALTGQDTAMEDYEDARDIRLQLIAKANGNDASIQAVNEQWLDFLSGRGTQYFGKGIATPTDAFTGALLSNEIALYEAAKTGAAITGIGATFVGYFERDTKLPEGFTGTVEDFEAKMAEETLANSKGLANGTMMLGRDQNGNPATIPARPADQGRGEFTFLITDDRGVPRPAIVQGIPVVGVERGVPGATWGYYYPDQKVWVASDDGSIYKKPPFAPANGGSTEIDADGNPRIRVDMLPGTITGGATGADARWSPQYANPTDGAGNQSSPSRIEYADAVLNGKTTVQAGFTPGGLGSTGALKAIMDTASPDQKKQIEEAAVNYQEGQRLWQEFRAGERDINMNENNASVKAFETFLGAKSNINGKQFRKEVLVVRGNQPEWRSIQYRDAYREVEPGLFVRKTEATEVNSFGKRLDEGSQTFPETIDVRSVQNDPAVKPFVGSIVTSKAAMEPASPSVDYFFRRVGGRSYAGDTVSEGRAVMLAAQQAGTATPRAVTTPGIQLPGYANPNYGGVSTRTTSTAISSVPAGMAIPKFTAPTAPVLAAAKFAGLGVSAGDTQAELLGQLRAVNAPGFATPNVGTRTGTGVTGIRSTTPIKL